MKTVNIFPSMLLLVTALAMQILSRATISSSLAVASPSPTSTSGTILLNNTTANINQLLFTNNTHITNLANTMANDDTTAVEKSNKNRQTQDKSHLQKSPRSVNAMVVGSSCPDSEGAWFCMTTTFQRCASGFWSEEVACAKGTVCEPEGLTYEYQTAFAISAASPSPSTSASNRFSRPFTVTSPPHSRATSTVMTISGTRVTVVVSTAEMSTTMYSTSTTTVIDSTETKMSSSTCSSTSMPGLPSTTSTGKAAPATTRAPNGGSSAFIPLELHGKRWFHAWATLLILWPAVILL